MGVEFKELEHIGDIVVGEKESDWVTSLRLMEAVTDKSSNQYFDLRKMKKTSKETIFGKGITMSMEELKELSNLLNVFFNDKGGNV
jgi:hypothetical protein